MERTSILQQLDHQICSYHNKYNFTKKQNIFCYKPDKKQISQFYGSMSEHFLQNKLNAKQYSKRKPHRALKIKSQIQNSIKNPLISCLPKQIKQNNLIDLDKVDCQRMSTVPLFSEVETSKKKKYMIAQQVRQMLDQDIRAMMQQKEQYIFRKKFPINNKHNRVYSASNLQTQMMIKEYNRLLIKFKNNKLNLDCQLNLLEREKDFNNLLGGSVNTNDQKFRILTLFKKLYMETNSENVNENLMNYIMKFQNKDKLNKKSKIKISTISSFKNLARSTNNTPKHTGEKSIAGNQQFFKLTYAKPADNLVRKSLISQLSKDDIIQDSNSNKSQLKQQSGKQRSRTSHFSNKLRLKL